MYQGFLDKINIQLNSIWAGGSGKDPKAARFVNSNIGGTLSFTENNSIWL